MDSLNVFFLFLAALLWLINLFIWAFVPSLILWLVEVALVVLALLRCLSRNINMRALENRRFNHITAPVRKWIKFQFMKFRDRKKCKYLKCISCKAQLRVRNLPGVHNVRCPKCGKEFQVKLK